MATNPKSKKEWVKKKRRLHLNDKRMDKETKKALATLTSHLYKRHHSLPQIIHELRRMMITSMLIKTDFNVTAAANLLHIHRTNIYHHLKNE